MKDTVILTNPYLFALTLVALFAVVFAAFLRHKAAHVAAHIVGFLCVVACITYALLLGATLQEILVYVSVFLLLSSAAFLPKAGTAKKDDPSEDRSLTQEDRKESEHEL